MNTTRYVELNGITEFKNTLTSDEIKVWIYTMPVKDLQTKHNENYKIINKLKNLNLDNQVIIFNEYIIASFNEIKNWEDEKYLSKEYRVINNEITTERKILERLLLESIKRNIDTVVYKSEKNSNSIYIKRPIFQNSILEVKRVINFDVNIEDNKDIIIGFTLSHSFNYINNLDKDLKLGKVKVGDKVKDFYNNSTYRFKTIAPFTISDNNEYMKCSILDYYTNKNQAYIVSNLNPNTKAVLVETDKGQILPYIPNRLKKVCDFGNLEPNYIKQCNKYIKLKSHDRMKISIDTTIDILKSNKYIQFKKSNMLATNIGYEKRTLYKPKFTFRNKYTHNTILYGLSQHGSYEEKEIEVSYLIDPVISNDKKILDKVVMFSKDLEEFSKSIGVNIKRIKTGTNFKNIRTQNKDLFEMDIREIVENYKNPVIVIMDDSNAQKYYESVKKIFGNKNNIATQFIHLSTLNYNQKSREAILLNILLGIYGKSGIQPWILQKPLNADCFIGLDVSRDNKVNTAGVIQVVGKDGRILRSKSVTSSQSGEKINIETIREILYEANLSYKKVYKEPLKHVVFHRDGISREELELLKDTAKNLEIKFDYVEITKNVQRRIATFNGVTKEWETQIGTYYHKDNKAYIVTTNPFANLGMAQPIRVRKVYGQQSIESIIEDVYKLSFMHIGSVLKARLPVTTHYADLSSTYGNRELMPRYIDSNALHFI